MELDFVNRTEELSQLDEHARAGGLLVVFGRRRVGKTRLLTTSARNSKRRRRRAITAGPGRMARMTDTTSKTCPSCFKDLDSRALRCPFCAQRQPDVVGLYRDVPGRVLGGVCAAVAQHFNFDVTLARIAFVVSLAVLGPVSLWAYFAAWLMTPFEQTGKAPLARLLEGLSKLFSPPANVARVE